mgnify:CR=1 FL=1
MSSIQSFYFVGVITLVSSAHVYGQKKDKMNVLFIIADDMRPELGCYGIEDIVTPHIDRLAEQATVFQNAYCNIPVSGASRASLFTGVYPCYPERFTAFDANAEKDCPKALSLPECFKKNGYYVISNGKVFHNITDHARSWSEYPWRVYPDGYGKDWAEYNKWELWQNEESSRYIHPKTLRGPFCESADVSDTTYIDGRVAQKTIADLRRLKEMKVPFFLASGSHICRSMLLRNIGIYIKGRRFSWHRILIDRKHCRSRLLPPVRFVDMGNLRQQRMRLFSERQNTVIMHV